MRLQRGKAKGFKRGGRLFVYTDAKANNVRLLADGIADADEHDLAAIVELQRIELSRLLNENERLSRRTDRLMNLYEREQALRLQMQKTIDRLSQRSGACGGDGPAVDTAEGAAQFRAHIEARLQRAEDQAERLKRVVARLVVFLGHDGESS